jgi:hypothetical protein
MLNMGRSKAEAFGFARLFLLLFPALMRASQPRPASPHRRLARPQPKDAITTAMIGQRRLKKA